MDPLAGDETFLFNGFRFDRRAGGLFRVDDNGAVVPVSLGARALDVLGVLLARGGEVVSKDEIIAAVWPGRIVEDSNLPTQILALRRVLDPDRVQGSCIQTIAGRGYRFVSAVLQTATPLAAALAATPDVAVPAQRDVGDPNLLRPPGVSAPVIALSPSTPKPAPPMSIVVLPFANQSSDPEQEYFVDAITDILTTDLSRIVNSFVISRTTAFTYKNKPIDVRRLGRDLGVRYVLEGSVRRLGEQVQVNVQLIDADNGSHIWSDRFDTDRTDLATAQSEITGRLAVSLRRELTTSIGRHIEQKSQVSLDAQDLVMRGRAAYYRPATEYNAGEALQLFEDALQIDPASAEAKVGIAGVLTENAIKGWSKSPREDQARAEKLLTEVLERDYNHVRAHFTMGLLRRGLQHRLAEARIELEKALSLDPNDYGALLQLGYTLNDMGEPESALPYFEKSLQLNPRSANIVYQYSGLGFCHLLLGNLDDSVDFFRKVRAANPRIYYVHLGLAGALGLRGDLDEAKASLADLNRLKPDLRSIKQLRSAATTMYPRATELWQKTLLAGLRRARMPEE